MLEQAKTRSPNAANKDRKNLLALWNWGVKTLDLDRNPCIKTDRFVHNRKPQYTPPEKDVLKVLACTSGQDRVFLICYMHTAARRTEIMRLTWDDINFERSEVRLWTRKTRDHSLEGVWLPMNKTLSDALWWQWENRKFKDNPHVFVDDRPGQHYGKPFKVRRQFIPGLCKRAGVKRFTFHALRRWVAQMLADKYKQSTQTVQRFLRHKNHRTTEIYLENLNKDLRPAADLLEGNFEENVPKLSPKSKKAYDSKS
jgi:integrase